VALAFASTLYAPAYTTLTTACVIFLYLSYVMPAAAGLRAYGRSWTRMGPFDLGGGPYRALAATSVAGVALLIWIGVQPPNEKALTATLAAVGLLAAAWGLGVRRRFRGPPAAAISLD
jgi:amino acid transporter